MCLHRAFQPSLLCRVFQEEQVSAWWGTASAWSSHSLLWTWQLCCQLTRDCLDFRPVSWAELLTTCFSCSQWLPKTIHSCDPVAAANLMILWVLADDKSGHSFAENSLCNEGLRSFCHRTVPKFFQGELALHRAVQLERTEGQNSWVVQAMPWQLLSGVGMRVKNKLQLSWKPGHVAHGALWQENLIFLSL